jgi:PPK2 family polyphosphate:nucleotide phosphotransferase
MYDLLYLMFAHNRHSLLIILQGIDTSGKDGVVRHLFASANPQGIRVYSFKKPTEVEVRHDFLWRCHRQVPECGLTTIFNRSYYEEVSTVRVHPELLKAQRLPEELLRRRDFFDRRFDHINDFERMLSNHGTVVMKFFLHISKDEQRSRLRDRLRDGKKNWKFSTADVRERKFWKEYQTAFEQMINATDTKWAPWHVLPADNKWYRDYLVSKAVVKALRKLKMKFPKANQEIDSIR